MHYHREKLQVSIYVISDSCMLFFLLYIVFTVVLYYRKEEEVEEHEIWSVWPTHNLTHYHPFHQLPKHKQDKLSTRAMHMHGDVLLWYGSFVKENMHDSTNFLLFLSKKMIWSYEVWTTHTHTERITRQTYWVVI